MATFKLPVQSPCTQSWKEIDLVGSMSQDKWLPQPQPLLRFYCETGTLSGSLNSSISLWLIYKNRDNKNGCLQVLWRLREVIHTKWLRTVPADSEHSVNRNNQNCRYSCMHWIFSSAMGSRCPSHSQQEPLLGKHVCGYSLEHCAWSSGLPGRPTSQFIFWPWPPISQSSLRMTKWSALGRQKQQRGPFATEESI